MSKHMIVSLIKSGVRLIGCAVGALAFRHWSLLAEHAFLFLFLAEIIGIIEEAFEK